MIRLTKGWIWDASAAVKLFLNDSLQGKANELLDFRLAHLKIPVFVPEFFFIECANVAWKTAKLSNKSWTEAKSHFDLATRLPVQSIDNRVLLVDAFNLASKFGISVYDAMYVAASVKKQLPLVTTDEKLIRKLPANCYELISLGSLQTP